MTVTLARVRPVAAPALRILIVALASILVPPRPVEAQESVSARARG